MHLKMKFLNEFVNLLLTNKGSLNESGVRFDFDFVCEGVSISMSCSNGAMKRCVAIMVDECELENIELPKLAKAKLLVLLQRWGFVIK